MRVHEWLEKNCIDMKHQLQLNLILKRLDDIMILTVGNMHIFCMVHIVELNTWKKADKWIYFVYHYQKSKKIRLIS